MNGLLYTKIKQSSWDELSVATTNQSTITDDTLIESRQQQSINQQCGRQQIDH